MVDPDHTVTQRGTKLLGQHVALAGPTRPIVDYRNSQMFVRKRHGARRYRQHADAIWRPRAGLIAAGPLAINPAT